MPSARNLNGGVKPVTSTEYVPSASINSDFVAPKESLIVTVPTIAAPAAAVPVRVGGTTVTVRVNVATLPA